MKFDVTTINTGITTLGLIIVACIGIYNSKVLGKVHILVNSKFSESLAEIVELKKLLQEEKEKNK